MQTYIDKVRTGEIEVNEKSLDEFIDFWHDSEDSRNMSLHEAIGISWEEYRENMLYQRQFLALIKSKSAT